MIAREPRSRENLERDNEELTRSNRELEEFAYVASHDLKSPLLVVLGFLELLDRTKRDQLDEDARMYVAAALRGATRMEQLIDDLLTYSRVGRSDRNRGWVDLDDVVTQLLAERAEEIQSAGASVVVTTLPAVLGDLTLLRQLLDNLISNAVKFRRPDRRLTISIETEMRSRDVLVRVSDNGVGVPPDDRESVFTMFSRLSQTNDRPGSGIGLAICHRVVQAHGGHIWVEDGIDGGACFCFTIPSSR